MFSAMKLSGSGMLAERTRIELISQNIANANNTELDKNGNPYRRKVAVLGTGPQSAFSDMLDQEIEVRRVQADTRTPFNMAYDPDHPDAIKEGDLEGYVMYPNVDIAKEMVDAMNAQRGYETNSQIFTLSKSLVETALTIGR